MPINFTCRFHPTDWFHEVGCPHKEWTKEELQSALKTAKQVNEWHMQIFIKHPELLREL